MARFKVGDMVMVRPPEEIEYCGKIVGLFVNICGVVCGVVIKLEDRRKLLYLDSTKVHYPQQTPQVFIRISR